MHQQRVGLKSLTHSEPPVLFSFSLSISAMPQYCEGFQEPDGGQAAVCIFAGDGAGGRAEVQRKRDGACCAFCSPSALQRAWASRVGKGNVVRKLKSWRQQGSPTYEAAFTMSSLVLLSEAQQLWLRYKAGERIRFAKRISWLHKKKSRLQHLLYGRRIPPVGTLSARAAQFARACCHHDAMSHRPTTCGWVKILCRQVRAVSHHVRFVEQPLVNDHEARPHRRAWWRACRAVRALLQPVMAQGPPYPAPVQWALETGILHPDERHGWRLTCWKLKPRSPQVSKRALA